jgi:hypothetical protein
MNEYLFDTKEQAIAELRKAVGDRNTSIEEKPDQPTEAEKGPCGSKTSTYTPGEHYTYVYKGTTNRAGSIVNCTCCQDDGVELSLKTYWDVVP